MGKVRLKITPSFISPQDAPSYNWYTDEKEMGEGATIGDLLADIASSHADFRKVVFNPDTRKLSEWVMVIHNDSLIQSQDVTDTKLNNGDSILILPIYEGG